VQLPKLGALRLRHSREALGTLKSVTLRTEGGRWIAALQTERDVDVPAPVGTEETGLDFGVVTTIMPSVGAPIKLPARIGRYDRRMKRLQRSVSRKQHGSANWKKAVARLAECHRRIAAMRRDFLHKKTTQLVSTNALLAIEDLPVKGMTASAVGSLQAPGHNVRQKAGLNRAILRNGWAMARSMLEYKAAWRGVALVVVPPAFTSQQCSGCGHVAAENRKNQALFHCVECGHTENADRNAARNILYRAKQILAGGGPPSTAGYAGTHACEGDAKHHPRPRSAAQGSAVGLPLAGTVSELSLSGNLQPLRPALGWRGCQSTCTPTSDAGPGG
jgi:putative transposase